MASAKVNVTLYIFLSYIKEYTVVPFDVIPFYLGVNTLPREPASFCTSTSCNKFERIVLFESDMSFDGSISPLLKHLFGAFPFSADIL